MATSVPKITEVKRIGRYGEDQEGRPVKITDFIPGKRGKEYHSRILCAIKGN